MPELEHVRTALGEAQRVGIIGATSLDDEIDHARLMSRAVPSSASLVVDLGSGGGLPALVIAALHPDLALLLVERRAKRADVLRRSVRALGWDDRVTVVAEDVSVVHRRGMHTGVADAVTARAFGSPAATLVAAVPFLGPSGVVICSDPPGSDGGRWSVFEEAGWRLESIDEGVAVLRRCLIR
jgi:16S rRNA G527 N7-methylase RsmG